MTLSKQRAIINIQWALFVLLALLTALFLAWQLLAKLDFLYPLWYEYLDIEHTIAVYGPQNRNRDHFETTTQAERIRLFAALVSAIHHQADGLETLVYHTPDGRPIAPLLTVPEIVHLQDVTRLVEVGITAGWVAMLSGLALIVLLRKQNLIMPAITTLLLSITAAMAAVALLIVLIGPVKVFYGLHTWIFPPDHPWFFYYQDSLMTTLMKAPDIFACITLAWAILSVLCLLGIFLMTRHILLFQQHR
ncbi:MAG: DUF1461 domain-containing protein [Candidatus Competibacteraceae bacterium]|jgi:hypothetical protein|nr:DUF1461 domain-containing protein [Candidatus Competibacteraceae bacterium]